MTTIIEPVKPETPAKSPAKGIEITEKALAKVAQRSGQEGISPSRGACGSACRAVVVRG